MMPPIEKSRELIRKELKKKFTEGSARLYEETIYQMCVQLSDDYDEDFDLVYQKYAYEKAGELIISFEHKTALRGITEDLKKCVIDWDSVVYKEYRRRQEIENEQLTSGVKIEKGEFPCRDRNCKSKECYWYLSQDRSADESMTINVICTKCGTRYKINS